MQSEISMTLRWFVRWLVVNFLLSPLGEESTLPVVCVDGDLPDELFTIIKEKLTHNPDEPRLVIFPGSVFDRHVRRRAIPGTLLVQFPTYEIDDFQAILMETAQALANIRPHFSDARGTKDFSARQNIKDRRI